MDINESLFITGKGFNAEGYMLDKGFLLKSGSLIRKSSGNSLSPGIAGLRSVLLNGGILSEYDENSYVINSDYKFSSISTAASFVCGRSANGRLMWVNKSGLSYNSIIGIKEEVLSEETGETLNDISYDVIVDIEEEVTEYPPVEVVTPVVRVTKLVTPDRAVTHDKLNLKSLIKTKEGRIELLSALTARDYYDKKLSTYKEDYWQCVPTPMSIIDKMVDKVDGLSNKSICVIFNPEFLEALVMGRGIDSESISFIADNKVLKEMAERVYGVEAMLLPKEDHNVKGLVKIMANKKFDIIFSNPPYNGNIDIKILNEVLLLAKELVIVHPSTWLLDLKGKSKMYEDFKKRIDGELKSVEVFNGNTVFGISLFVPIVISHIDNSYRGDCSVNFFGEEFIAGVTDITKFGKEWLTLVKPFKEKVQDSDSVWGHKTMNINNNKFYSQLSAMRGHEDYNINNMYKDDFYTMVMKDSENNKGVRKADSGAGFYAFSTEVERDNFIHYLKTDFARFCLALYKNKSDLHRGELEFVPWMDFSKPWDDAKLYKHFNIDEDTQAYIREFLPDYYGIRGGK